MIAPTTRPMRLGVLTSGGDAQGMNAAVRAVVRSALSRGVQVYGIFEGYQGLVEGGELIRPLRWEDVGSVLSRGGTVLGTARSPAFRERHGLRRAARHLLEHDIDRLVVIGGDGSLSGAYEFRQLWPSLLAELADAGDVTADQLERHPVLMLAGLVGSIDNDLVGTDMTIGADSALHRIVEAMDAISSTASSHRRSFVVEVMGRRCGYLALMGAIAGGADYVLVPENPPEPGWEDRMWQLLDAGEAEGRRDSIVVVAEGARDTTGAPITAEDVRSVLQDRHGEDTRVTILGHVQRGGTPSAFDRWMPTLLGHAAVEDLLAATAESEPHIVGFRHNRVWRVPLTSAVEQTRSVPDLIAAKDFAAAMALRGGNFVEMLQVFQAMAEAPGHRRVRSTGEVPAGAAGQQEQRAGRRIGVMHAGGLAPGMNTAARAAVRLGIDRGHTMMGVRNSFDGLAAQEITELTWGDVEGWTSLGGAELGCRRAVPADDQLYAIGRSIERAGLDALLVIGGWPAYRAVHRLWSVRDTYPAFKIPIVLVPASVDNNLPGWEMSIGADTALNVVVDAVDKIKQSAIASKRCFVIEVMGRYCGYLAMMSAMATGAERVYLHEDGITLEDLKADVDRLIASFRGGRGVFVAIRNERANPLYTTDFLASLFEQESGGLFDVRTNVLGHVQQGGNPSPSDRILATGLAAYAIDYLDDQLEAGGCGQGFVGAVGASRGVIGFKAMEDLVDWRWRRPREQWWRALGPVLQAMTEPLDPGAGG